ncbi:DMT family transporter [Desulfobaculum bizertense]|uniref:Permease of the drug/metabolite transporter (DMT) superfamily n=1 Tax=Desulfobaculum bizertense DSM 18034 TaxID=1121442 RepID=A0A1T4WKQ1_9BACT|nr:DMT family transporter [Desulfobaculum bizertense]SKA77912.1 Permease of the drug/metabolite transporter (DMT) superfamily [Desulfobaculum bizertense DSM 18034]
MQTRILKANILLLLTAAIWGSGFVAQRSGMDYVGPMTYSALRFGIGALSLTPLLWLNSRKGIPVLSQGVDKKFIFLAPCLTGLALFVGISLQQIGLLHTTAGKAGFITGLYVALVPILGLFVGLRPGFGGLFGPLICAAGLYFISVTKDFTLATSDALIIISAFAWAIQVLLLGWLSPKIDGIRLAFGQFLVCSVLSLFCALAFETLPIQGILDGWFPIVYGGVMPVGVAFTLQVIAQKDSPPAHAATILSMEAVFAAVGGWLILGETLSSRALLGCSLMLAGMLIAQLWPKADKAR